MLIPYIFLYVLVSFYIFSLLVTFFSLPWGAYVCWRVCVRRLNRTKDKKRRASVDKGIRKRVTFTVRERQRREFFFFVYQFLLSPLFFLRFDFTTNHHQLLTYHRHHHYNHNLASRSIFFSLSFFTNPISPPDLFILKSFFSYIYNGRTKRRFFFLSLFLLFFSRFENIVIPLINMGLSFSFYINIRAKEPRVNMYERKKKKGGGGSGLVRGGFWWWVGDHVCV